MTLNPIAAILAARRRAVPLFVLLSLLPAACKQLDAPADPAEGEQAQGESTGADDGAVDEGTSAEVGATSEDEAAADEAGATAPDPNAVAVVNGVAIPLPEFQRQAFDTQSYHVEQGGIDPNTAEGQQKLLFFRRQVLRDMIDQELIEQAADELGISVSDADLETETDKLIEEVGGQAAFARKLAETQTSKDDWMAMERAAILGRKVLDKVTADLADTAEFVRARQIFCKDQAACQAALDRLMAGEDFAALAAELSEDSSTKDQGGDLGWITRGSLLSQELEAVVFSQALGERSAVVQSELGYHVVEVLERDAARELSDEQLMPLREKRVLEWLDGRRKAAKIDIYIEDLKDLMTEGDPGEG